MHVAADPRIDALRDRWSSRRTRATQPTISIRRSARSRTRCASSSPTAPLPSASRSSTRSGILGGERKRCCRCARSSRQPSTPALGAARARGLTERLLDDEALPHLPVRELIDARVTRRIAFALLAMGTAQAAVYLVRPTTSYRLLGLGDGTTAVGLVAASFALVPLFLAIPLGRRADRRHGAQVAARGLRRADRSAAVARPRRARRSSSARPVRCSASATSRSLSARRP